MRLRAAALLVVLLVVAGCSSSPPDLSSPKVDFDTPALRAIKKKAGIEPCTAPTAAKAKDGLPDVDAPCLGGGPTVNLARLRGPLVVNLWAQWCGPCRQEMPVLQEFHEKYGKRVPIIGVDYTDPQPELALELAKHTGVTYPLVADYEKNIRVVGLPTTIMVDETGKITYKQGLRIESVAQLRRLVAEHLGVEL